MGSTVTISTGFLHTAPKRQFRFKLFWCASLAVLSFSVGCQALRRGFQDLKVVLHLSNPPEQSSTQRHAELYHEMFSVVSMREPESAEEFSGWVQGLNAGASLEGVYNALTHSSKYRAWEETTLGASPKALKMFATELVRLELALPTPTEFDASSAQPLAAPVQPSIESPTDIPRSLSFGVKTTGTLVASELEQRYVRVFVGSSIYTLKRVLGDEAMKVVAHVGTPPTGFKAKLATWYAKWAASVGAIASSSGINFGLDLRNRSDEGFHYRWAMQSTEDALRWEVLNRLHRLMNASHLGAQSGSSNLKESQ